MPARTGLVTKGIFGPRGMLRACDRAGKESKREGRNAFKEAGDIVRVEATHRFQPIDARSAAGYRTRVRQRGVAVEQSLRRTTGEHPEFGSLQMRRALIPALDARSDRVERELEHAIDKVADHFENR
jgi:hypothetical protein